MCSVIDKQLLLTAYAYLFLIEQQKEQQGSEALQMDGIMRWGRRCVDEALNCVGGNDGAQPPQQVGTPPGNRQQNKDNAKDNDTKKGDNAKDSKAQKIKAFPETQFLRKAQEVQAPRIQRETELLEGIGKLQNHQTAATTPKEQPQKQAQLAEANAAKAAARKEGFGWLPPATRLFKSRYGSGEDSANYEEIHARCDCKWLGDAYEHEARWNGGLKIIRRIEVEVVDGETSKTRYVSEMLLRREKLVGPSQQNANISPETNGTAQFAVTVSGTSIQEVIGDTWADKTIASNASIAKHQALTCYVCNKVSAKEGKEKWFGCHQKQYGLTSEAKVDEHHVCYDCVQKELVNDTGLMRRNWTPKLVDMVFSQFFPTSEKGKYWVETNATPGDQELLWDKIPKAAGHSVRYYKGGKLTYFCDVANCGQLIVDSGFNNGYKDYCQQHGRTVRDGTPKTYPKGTKYWADWDKLIGQAKFTEEEQQKLLGRTEEARGRGMTKEVYEKFLGDFAQELRLLSQRPEWLQPIGQPPRHGPDMYLTHGFVW